MSNRRKTKPASAPSFAVAAELGIDPDRLLAEIADATATPIKWARA